MLERHLALAIPRPVTYTVAFNSNGGSAVPSQRIKAGGKATEPAEPTKDGYNFVEWDLGETEYDFDTPVESNFVLKAKWEQAPAPVHSATVRLVNNGNAALSYSATPLAGTAETGTIAAGESASLANTVDEGEAVSTAYSAITVQYEGGEPISADLTVVATSDIYVDYEFTNTP